MEVLICSYGGVIEVLQWCHRGVAMVLWRCCYGVLAVLLWCYGGVAMVT